MADIPPAAQEAIELARKGDIDGAIARGREAADAHPGDAGLRAFMAMLHIRRNELSEALPHLRAALAAGHADPFLTVELVRVLIALGETDEAGTLLDRLRLPGRETLRLRAMLLQRRGDFAKSGALYQEVVNADPRDFESWGNLGVCLVALDQLPKAIAALEKSLSLRPDRASIRQTWMKAHFLAGTAERALADLYELARRHPSEANPWVAVAFGEKLLGRAEKSLRALEEAVQRDPANSDALVALADTAEQRNDLERLEDIVNDLGTLAGPVGQLPLLKARLALRRGDIEQALALARSTPASIDAGTRAQIMGQCLDRLGDSECAWQAFTAMNAEDARSGNSAALSAEMSRRSVIHERQLLTRDWVASWEPSAPPAHREPAFIVGFPRSGTTLLDTFLMGHPDAVVAEEEPMLTVVGEKVRDLSRIADFQPNDIEELRNLYFEVAENYVPDGTLTRLLIDKNPFAMGSLATIHRLFASARVIFVERHPCDVVLSCFMTRFQPTGLGANFLTLENTALLYDEMMQLWTASEELLPINTHRVRYERLVENAEAELRPVADFLGLEWKPELLDHLATAGKRAFIKTPSYAQVMEPVNRKPVGRWMRYRKQLEPVLPILTPWAERMAYAL